MPAPDSPERGPERAKDDAAIFAAADADPEAFGQLFDRHAAAIHRYLARRVGPDEADDLLADVFVAAFRARHRYDRSRPDARPWLYGIASNLSARAFRSRTRAEAAAARLAGRPEEPTDPQATRTDQLDAEATWPDLAIALDKLPDDTRDTLLLHVWEDLTYEEIAVAMDVPIGTVRSRIHRARSALRELLGGQRETTEGTGE